MQRHLRTRTYFREVITGSAGYSLLVNVSVLKHFTGLCVLLFEKEHRVLAIQFYMAIVEAQMLIRKPANEAFNAFIDPEITTHFWFTKSTGKLKKGKKITWEWEMYQATVHVLVKEIIKDKKVSIIWDNPSTTVDFELTAQGENTTYVVIKNYGFTQTGKELLETMMATTAGFTTVLGGLKAYLEYGISLNLIADKFPTKI